MTDNSERSQTPPTPETISVVDPLKPPVSLLVKLGSALVHVAEARGAGGHPYDWQAYESIVYDREVIEWIRQMTELAFLPVRR